MSLDMNKQFLYLMCYDGFVPMNLLMFSHCPFIVTVMVSGIASQNRLPCLKVVNSNGILYLSSRVILLSVSSQSHEHSFFLFPRN